MPSLDAKPVVVQRPLRGGLGLTALEAMQESLGARVAGMALRLDGKDMVLGTDDEGVALAFAGAEALADGRPVPGADVVEPIADADEVSIGHVFLVLDTGVPGAADRARVLARNLSILLHRYRQRDSVQESYDALLEIGMEMQALEPRLSAVFELVVRRARALLGADLAWLALLRDDALELTVDDGVRTDAFRDIEPLPRDHGIGGMALRDMQPVFVPDYASHPQAGEDHVRDVAIAEGIVSSLSVPLASRGQLLGVLHVANRSPTDYTDSQASLLWALANQASVAIVNAQLYASREERNRLLERTFEIHRELTAAGLAGAGLDGIGQAVAGLLGATLVLEQEVVSPFRRAWDAGPGGADEGAPGLELPLLGGVDELGTLRLPGVRELDTTQRMALEQGGTVIALELAKLRMGRDIEWRLRGEILEELLELEGEAPQRLVDRAALLGLDLSTPWRVLVVQPDPRPGPESPNLLTTVRGAMSTLNLAPSLTVQRGTSVVLAIGERDDVPSAIPDAIIRSARRVGAPCSIGISSARTELSICYREARACVRLARDVGTGERALRFEQVGSLRFLLDAPDPQHAIALVLDELGVFMRHDATSRTALLPTVRAYVEEDGHQPSVAARCFIHVSTLKYRIGRINELLDEPLSAAETRFRLRLAFRVLDLLTALGVEVDAQRSPEAPAG